MYERAQRHEANPSFKKTNVLGARFASVKKNASFLKHAYAAAAAAAEASDLLFVFTYSTFFSTVVVVVVVLHGCRGKKT